MGWQLERVPRLDGAFAAVVAGVMDAEGGKVGSPRPVVQTSAPPLPHSVEESSLLQRSWPSSLVDDSARPVEHQGQSEGAIMSFFPGITLVR